ncbi:PaaI family thioesterase [Minwuia sp.]|uniref:PaaI family thioesterase n=1 Tax=Minwuia sp. TaxID=2493630 RepID=UPI003A92F1E6
MNAPLHPDVPEGFKPFGARDGMFGVVGPIYGKVADGEASLGFRVEEKHLNPVGTCHGGMLATLVDVQIGFGAAVLMGRRIFLPTINLNCDFLAPPQLGQWVHGRTELVRATPRMAFCNAWLYCEDEIVLRANGIMKVPSEGDRRFAFPDTLQTASPASADPNTGA